MDPHGTVTLGAPKHTYPTNREVDRKTIQHLKAYDLIIGVRCHRCDTLWHEYPRNGCPKGCRE